MEDGKDFRDALPSDSDINDLIEWFESDDVLNITGHIGERQENSSHWEDFYFTINDSEGEESRITIDSDDLPNGYSWDDLFDYLDYLAGEYDVDYDNPYADAE